MHRSLFNSVVFVALVSAVASAAPELTMQDLQALDKQQSWSELLDKADQVKPTARTADWNALVKTAATHVLEQIDKTSHSDWRVLSTLVAVVPAAELKYAFLKSDKGYLEGKGKTLQRIVAACTSDNGCGALVVSLSDGIEQFPKGTARDIALLVSDSPADALHFWALAADEDKETCKQSQLGRAVLDTLRHGKLDRQVADAQHVAGVCFAALESDLVVELVDAKDGAPYLKNACPVLKTHGAMTIAKKKKCS